MFSKVIVFGATGNVGSIVARTARDQGAKVFLAMRDITKPIPGLNSNQKPNEDFERVKADLQQPHEVSAAIKETGATAAFMYVAHGSPDQMQATLQAAKSAGIQFLVLLSSFTIRKRPEDVAPESRIAYAHARVEMNVERIFGTSNYVALRVGAFATNTLRWAAGLGSGEVRLETPTTQYDLITPQDMGESGGRILVQGQRDGQHIVYLYGPRLITQRDAFKIAAAALQKDVVEVDSSQSEDTVQQSSADSVVLVRYGPGEGGSTWFEVPYDNHSEGVENVQKYAGHLPMCYRDWVEANVGRFDVQ